MVDLRQTLINTVSQDATFQSLTGAAGLDTRFYWYFNADARITVAQPAYVTYAMMTSAEKFRAVREPTFSMVVWGRDLLVVEQVAERIRALLDQQELTSPAGRTVYAKQISRSDSFQTQPNFAGIQVQYRMGYLDLG